MTEFKNTDKDLVAEQPGLGLSFIGLFLAFFMGLAVRAAVSPDRVQEHLLRATENIHKDVRFSFKKAYVSFSRGLWPDLSVVIEDVGIESHQSCWLTPLAEVHEIRLPLSMKHLFRGQILIHEIFADEVNLSLRKPYAPCAEDSVNEPKPAPAPSSAKTANAQKSVAHPSTTTAHPTTTSTQVDKPVMGKFENVQRRNPIDTIQIDSLKIHYLPVAFTSFYIENFETRLRSEDPRWIQVLGRLVLDGDTLMGDYSSHADLQIDSIEGADAKVTATATGALREGSYTFTAAWNAKENSVALSADAIHLPLSQILPLLKKYRWVESEFNGKRAWISGHMKMQSVVDKFKQAPMALEQLKLEGDLGEVACKQVQIQSFQPLQFQPVDFDIRGLNIKELLTFLNRPHPSPALGDLGIFNGTAHFISPEQLVLRGDYSGLEFIFSNRGNRQTQVLSLVSGELELNKKQWDISIDRVKPVEGIFEGKVKMRADKDFKDLNIDAQITELGLSPRVQLLMTGGGSLGALSGQLQARLKAAQVSELKGQLKWDQLLIEGLRLNRPKITLQSHPGEEIQMNLSAQELELASNSPAAQVFSPIFKSHPGPSMLLKSPTGVIRTQKFAVLSWDQVQAQSPWGVLKSHGRWNEKSQLSGEIQIQGQPSEVWRLQGTRNSPELRRESL